MEKKNYQSVVAESTVVETGQVVAVEGIAVEGTVVEMDRLAVFVVHNLVRGVVLDLLEGVVLGVVLVVAVECTVETDQFVVERMLEQTELLEAVEVQVEWIQQPAEEVLPKIKNCSSCHSPNITKKKLLFFFFCSFLFFKNFF